MAKALLPPGQQELTILHPHEFTTSDRDWYTIPKKKQKSPAFA
jgi:hypothetical protein